MKIIGIDLGDQRTGVAYSDILGLMSTRSETISEYNREKLLSKLVDIINLEKPDKIVVGLPVNMNGTEGESARKCQKRWVRSKARTGCPGRSSLQTAEIS